MSNSRRFFRAFLLSLGLLLLASGRAPGADPVTYSLGWVPMARDAGFFAAQEKGWYKAAGLEVKIVRGQGAGIAAKDLAAGAVDFGHSDPRSLIMIRGQGGALRMVGLIHAKNMYSFFTLEGSGIRTPKDIEGRKYGAAKGESSFVYLPVLASINDIDLKKVNHVLLDPPSTVPSLISGKVDVISLFTISLPVIQQVAGKRGKKVVPIPFARYGVDVYTSGMAASDRLIREKPDVARRFVETSYRGFAWAVEHSDEALEIFHKHNPTAGRGTSRQIWEITVDHLLTPEAKKLGIGRMSLENWEKIVRLTAMTSDKPITVRASALFTNRFLPKLFPKPGR